MYICEYCNKEFGVKSSWQAHRCLTMLQAKRAREKEFTKEIVDKYANKEFGISELCIEYNLSRPRIEKILKQNKIPLRSFTYTNRRKEKYKSTCKQTYGVSNVAQVASIRNKVQDTVLQKYGVSNPTNSKISKLKHYLRGLSPDPIYEKDFALYKNKVERLTKKNRSLMPISNVCYYTTFPIDHNIHYNTWNKATIDHKMSILKGFELNISPDEIASLQNLVWCAKIVNTYKGQLTEDQFRCLGIIERFQQYKNEICELTIENKNENSRTIDGKIKEQNSTSRRYDF